MKFDEEYLGQLEDGDDQFDPTAQLIHLGREKGFVTLDDILALFPDAEQNVDQLEEAFTALLNAGIIYKETALSGDPSDDEDRSGPHECCPPASRRARS